MFKQVFLISAAFVQNYSQLIGGLILQTQRRHNYEIRFKKGCVGCVLSEKFRSIYSCQIQMQVMDIIHSPEMILVA